LSFYKDKCPEEKSNGQINHLIIFLSQRKNLTHGEKKEEDDNASHDAQSDGRGAEQLMLEKTENRISLIIQKM
jgi:hypothetical protein